MAGQAGQGPWMPVEESDNSEAVESSEEPDEESSGEDADCSPEGLGQRCSRCTPRVIALSVCGGCCCLLLLIIIALMIVGWTLVDLSKNRKNEQDPHMNPIMYPRYNGCAGCSEGYKTDEQLKACAEPCISMNFLLDWEQLSKDAGYQLVYFPSRPGPLGEPRVNISAWWMPPPPRPGFDVGKAPRVVALHGLASNFNHCGAQATCFLLRQMGFGCLVPSVRDYGLSGPSTHRRTMTWGYDYHLDLLGAWDYAVNDPDGILGGALPDQHVGVMGFSKGAYGTAIAFGMEPRIPGAWMDSGPYCGLEGMIAHTLAPYVGDSFAKLLSRPVFWGAQVASEVPVDYYDPFELLVNCSVRGPVRQAAVSQGMFDTDVPLQESERLSMLLGGLPACYELTTYTPPEYCNTWTHHHEMWEFPDDTRSVMCKFWAKSFNISEAYCRLESLPNYQRWYPPSRLPPGTPSIVQTLGEHER